MSWSCIANGNADMRPFVQIEPVCHIAVTCKSFAVVVHFHTEMLNSSLSIENVTSALGGERDEKNMTVGKKR